MEWKHTSSIIYIFIERKFIWVPVGQSVRSRGLLPGTGQRPDGPETAHAAGPSEQRPLLAAPRPGGLT